MADDPVILIMTVLLLIAICIFILCCQLPNDENRPPPQQQQSYASHYAAQQKNVPTSELHAYQEQRSDEPSTSRSSNTFRPSNVPRRRQVQPIRQPVVPIPNGNPFFTTHTHTQMQRSTCTA
jgi:cytoskeletal protein RodZ